MLNLARRWFAVTLLAFALPTASAAENIVSARLVSESAALAEGKALRVGVLLEHPPGWHSYYKNPGDAGLPTTLEWQLPHGFKTSGIDWPAPKRFAEGNLTTYGYSDNVVLPVTIQPPATLNEAAYTLRVKAQWLVCKDICIPESKDLSLELPVGNGGPSFNAYLFTEQPAADETSFWPALLLALLGGVILNLMPCVLPVLSLKALAIAKKASAARAETIGHGLAYTAGILLSFAMIAALLIGLQHAGQAVGWGFQMQSPGFVIFLIFILFLVGLNLSGLFDVPVLFGNISTSQQSLRGSFLTGVLATLVATPCTAPFMATAVGLALSLPAWQAMLIFLSLGAGLALPFLLISIFPASLKFLPKPGAWMEKLKLLLAVPMYASVIWLFWVLHMQMGLAAVACVLAALLVLFGIFWKKSGRGLKTAWIAALLVAGVAAVTTPQGKIEGEPYSKLKLEELRAQGKAVYVDATAAWCLTCQVNKKLALDTKATRAAFEQYNVTFMVADWTSRNVEITEFLNSFGYNGVPLNVYYPVGGEPVVLPQLLSEKLIVETVSR